MPDDTHSLKELAKELIRDNDQLVTAVEYFRLRFKDMGEPCPKWVEKFYSDHNKLIEKLPLEFKSF